MKYYHLQVTDKFFKPIGITQSGEKYLEISKGENPLGVVYAAAATDFPEEFVEAVAQKRFWDRK